MVTNKAKIERSAEKTALTLQISNEKLEIVLTSDDNPNAIKVVFNKLLNELKTSHFNFELEDTEEDLYHHVSDEYIKQLNSDLDSIYRELESYELID